MENKVSVVIVNRNGENFLKSAFDSAIEQGKIVGEIIVVDNASTDNSLEIIKKYPVRVIKNKKNSGFAAGNNQGIKAAKYPYILLLNMDAKIEKDSLKKMLNIIERDEKIGCVLPVILNPDRSIQSLGITHLISGLGINQRDSKEKIFGFYGACVLLRKEMLDKIGKFDNVFFTFYEDLELSYRIRLSKWKIGVSEDVYIIHKGSGAGAYHKYYFLHRNKWIIILRYWALNWILAVLPIILFIDFLSIIRALLSGKILDAIRARAYIIKNFFNIRIQGKEYQNVFKKLFPMLDKNLYLIEVIKATVSRK